VVHQPGVRVFDAAWQAVGMTGCASIDVACDAATAQPVGAPGDFLRRPGFWQGGVGVAACWYGGSLALAETLGSSTASVVAAARGPFRLAALGRVDLALKSTAAFLRECAAWIDANPTVDAFRVARATECRVHGDGRARRSGPRAGRGTFLSRCALRAHGRRPSRFHPSKPR
jgi:hypothetical protein